MTTQEISLNAMVDAARVIEKLRLASEHRRIHLARQGKQDTEIDELHSRLKDLEDFVDGRIAYLIQDHPAYPWFSRVKGVGGENVTKVVGFVNIEKASHISSLWKFAGFSVENGVAPKRRKGSGALEYNSHLRVMCWRLGTSLLRARGKFYEYYLKEKDKYLQKYENQGIKVVPASNLPQKEGKKYEPEGIISEGHVHNQALRKMIKLFLACLWLVWRANEGLPITRPYALDKLGHSAFIDPWEMTDRERGYEKPIGEKQATIWEKPIKVERADKTRNPIVESEPRRARSPVGGSKPNLKRKPE